MRDSFAAMVGCGDCAARTMVPPPWRARDFERGARCLPHAPACSAGPSAAPWARRCRPRRPPPRGSEAGAVGDEGDPEVVGAGVLAHVADRLLGDPQQLGLGAGRQRRPRLVEDEVDAQVHVLGDLVDVVGEGAGQSVVGDVVAQVEDRVADLGDDAADLLAQAVGQRDGLGSRRRPMRSRRRCSRGRRAPARRRRACRGRSACAPRPWPGAAPRRRGRRCRDEARTRPLRPGPQRGCRRVQPRGCSQDHAAELVAGTTEADDEHVARGARGWRRRRGWRGSWCRRVRRAGPAAGPMRDRRPPRRMAPVPCTQPADAARSTA